MRSRGFQTKIRDNPEMNNDHRNLGFVGTTDGVPFFDDQRRGAWPFVLRCGNLPDALSTHMTNCHLHMLSANEFWELDLDAQVLRRTIRNPKSLKPHLIVLVDDLLSAYKGTSLNVPPHLPTPCFTCRHICHHLSYSAATSADSQRFICRQAHSSAAISLVLPQSLLFCRHLSCSADTQLYLPQSVLLCRNVCRHPASSAATSATISLVLPQHLPTPSFICRHPASSADTQLHLACQVCRARTLRTRWVNADTDSCADASCSSGPETILPKPPSLGLTASVATGVPRSLLLHRR